MILRSYLIAFIVSILLSFALYGNTIGGDFVYDDEFFIYRSDLRHHSALFNVWGEYFRPNNPSIPSYRPMSVFTLVLNFVLFGNSPTSFHVLNIILNGIVVFLVFFVILKLFNNKMLAVFTAIFYAFLPIHTEAVALIKARDDILATLFVLTSWVIFLKATSKGINAKLILLSSATWILGMLSKEIAIVAPSLFVFVYWIYKKSPFFEVIKLFALFVPAIIFYFFVRFLVLGEQFLTPEDVYFIFNPLIDADFATRIWTAFKIAFIYISKIFVPINLSATYSYNHLKLVSDPFSSIETLLGIIFLAVILLLIIYKKFRSTYGIGALIFLLPYSMMSKFFSQFSEIASEKWMYLPSIGISLIAGFIIYRFFQYKKWLGVCVLVAILAIYTPILIQRNTIWASRESLARGMVKDAPDSAHAHYSLAVSLLDQGKYMESKEELGKALKIYLRHPPFLNLAGTLALKEGREDIAIQILLKSIESRPDEIKVLVLIKQGRYQESIDLINSFSERLKKKVDMIFLMAVSYYRLGMIEEAKKYFHWDTTISEEEKIKIIEDF